MWAGVQTAGRAAVAKSFEGGSVLCLRIAVHARLHHGGVSVSGRGAGAWEFVGRVTWDS